MTWRRALFGASMLGLVGCRAIAGDYETQITTALSTGASMTAGTRTEDVKITGDGNDLTFVFPACTIKAVRSGDKLEFPAGQQCTRDLKAVTLKSGQGEKKSGQVLLALVWTKDGTPGTINERAVMSSKSGCR